MRTSIFRVVVVLLVIFSRVPGQDGSKLDLALWMDWETVGSPQLSPDGKQVVFTRSWNDKFNDRRMSDLWIVDVDGKRPRSLVKGSGARWSPDGERILYVAEGEPKGSQLWVMWVKTREATQITRLDQSPGGARWSPDGDSIAFSMVVPEKAAFSISLPKRPKGAKWAEDPKVVTRLRYRRDRRGYRPLGWRHLFVVDARGGTPRQVTRGDFDHGSPRWMPDGKRLVFSGLLDEEADWETRESEVYQVAIADGEVTQLTSRKGPDMNPVPSPDGSRIAYLGYDVTTDTYNIPKIHVMNADGSGVEVVCGDLDRQASDLQWSADGEALLFTARNEGKSNLRIAKVKGPSGLITGHRGVLRSVHVGEGGSVGVLKDARNPGDIVFIGSSGEVRRLTQVNDDLLKHRKIGEIEEFRVPSVDGLEVQGWIVKPPDFDPKKRYPLILQIHGGPHGMYDCAFDFERQNHAANGYVVVYTNPRGSVGYGKKFGNAINNAYPGKDYDDLMACVDHVVKQGYIDESDMNVYGGSGGGVLTAWIVGKTGRFSSAVSMYPVINWISFVGTTDGPYWYTNFKKRPWEDITEHWERSPLRLVGNVTTPTMLLTGELDLRTPMAQTEEYFQALKLRKIPTVMVRVPGEYHGAASRPSNRMRRILYVRKWFGKYTKKGGTN